MNKVLLVNHYQKACGVQNFGKRVYDLVKDSKSVKYFYIEVEDEKTFLNYAKKLNPDVIIFNWHRGTMSWLTEQVLRVVSNTKHYFIFHEEVTQPKYDKYLFFGDYDFSRGKKFDKKVLLPRPLLKSNVTYRANDIITIGSFGFGFWNKGYHTLTKLVNDTFDRAKLNFHMPYSYFGDPTKQQTMAVEAECRRLITKPNIILTINHDFLDDNGVLQFLANNDINVFLYEENGEGISSVIDYALSVKRPIAISNSKMFRHISKPEITLENNSLLDILKRGTESLQTFYERWNPENFLNEMDKIFNET